MLRWALLLLAGCDGVFGIQHIKVPPPDAARLVDAATGYAGVVLGDHPVGYWPLDEASGVTAHDLVGAHDGVYKGSGIGLGNPPPFPSAQRSVAFDGVNAAVDLGDVFGFPGTAPYTIEAWFSPMTLGNNEFYEIISKWREPGSMDPSGWNVFYSRTNPVLQYTREAEGHVTVMDRTAAGYTDGWHYVAATMDDVTMTMSLYYDGKPVDSTAVTFGLDTIPLSLEIGGGNGNAITSTMYGSIAQVAIYDHALTAQQISAHYVAAAI